MMHALKRAVVREDSQRNGTLPAILKICQKMTAERDLAALLDLIAREAKRLMAADRASIFLLDREKGELWSQVALGSAPIRFDARLGIAGAAALTGQIINVKDAHQDPRFNKEVDVRTGYRTRSMLTVPLRNHEGEVIGAFQALNKKEGVFTTNDEEIAKALAAHAAIAIETAQLIEQLRQHRDQLLEENTQLWQEVGSRFATHNILGTSEKMQHIVRLIEQLRDSAVNVLITGESGTGKELVARAIHYNSARARRPLVTLNCAALPDSLVESELFGIERGVATGVEGRIGKFEAAAGGTLFLDEVGDLSLPAQAKMLRVLQEREIERLGGRKAIPVDVRILAATNKDLEGEIKKGTFREDLYYRLKVIHVHTPPLREIQEDIPLLANSFLARFCQEMKREPQKLAPEALRCLTEYPWPGNVRELENEIKRVVALSGRKVVTEEDLSEAIRNSGDEGVPAQFMPAGSLKETVATLEKRLIVEALQTRRYNQQQAAKALGLSRQGLIKKMKRYGIRAA
ncbi:MAG: sigma-54-dependent Fis family transcriptional regulator [Deltaproteobacteria bacterium]|nr:sigma-54-dependent Fis family transcriptional regulator [Deltaproteobacteria bacterium]